MDIVIDRQIVLYIHSVEGPLYPANDLYPDNDLYPNSHTIIIDGSDYSIVGGSVTLTETICEGELNFGSPIANMFECELYGLDNITLANNKIEVYVRENQVQKPLFVGYIDSCKEGRLDNTKRIVAYDALYKNGSVNVADWWEEFWTNRDLASLKQVRESLLDYMNIRYDSTITLVNDSMTITKFDALTYITFEDMLKMICELSFVFPNIGRDGALEFVTLDTSSYIDLDANADGSVNYEGSNASWEDYVTAEITGINIYTDASNVAQSVGTGDNKYSISGNLLILDKSSEAITTLCENLLDSVEGITYMPCEIPLILSSFDYTLGKKFKTEKGYHFIMQSSYSGVQLVNQTLNCNADGPYLKQEGKSYNSEIITGRKISRIQQDIDNINIAIGDESEGIIADINLVKDEIVLKVDDNGNIVKVALATNPSQGTTFKVSADNIDFIANDVMNLSANQIGISSTNFSINKATGAVEVKGTVTATSIKIYDKIIGHNTQSDTDFTLIDYTSFQQLYNNVGINFKNAQGNTYLYYYPFRDDDTTPQLRTGVGLSVYNWLTVGGGSHNGEIQCGDVYSTKLYVPNESGDDVVEVKPPRLSSANLSGTLSSSQKYISGYVDLSALASWFDEGYEPVAIVNVNCPDWMSLGNNYRNYQSFVYSFTAVSYGQYSIDFNILWV